MSTHVRDTVVLHFAKLPETKYLSIDELQAILNHNRDSIASVCANLAIKRVLIRRKRDSNVYLFEYAKGPRIDWALKQEGVKFSPRPRKKAPIAAAPVERKIPKVAEGAEGAVGLVIRIDGTAHAISLAQAKLIYDQLDVVFGQR